MKNLFKIFLAGISVLLLIELLRFLFLMFGITDSNILHYGPPSLVLAIVLLFGIFKFGLYMKKNNLSYLEAVKKWNQTKSKK